MGDTKESPSASLTPSGDPLLAARFSRPVLPPTYVRRPRLIERLTQGVRGPLTLVNGAAGAGKTLLVADWISTLDVPGRTAWLAVEQEDNGPGVFWTYVLETLRHHGLASPDDIGTPARPGEVDHSLLARLAARLSDGDEPVVLVLDEFDRVASSAELADELQFVLRHSDGGLRLVLVTRTEPLLPLHRYRAAGEVTDIRSADLAFRPEETAELLDRHGMDLSQDGIRALNERTGGWAAGLRLCILAAEQADQPETFLKDFEAGQSILADFLLAEVLDAQPPATQDLLLRSSILDRIHPDLANALTGRDDAETVLAGLQRANAFVESTGHSWYRIHPLFAEILRVHLRVREPGLEAELHRTAAHRLSEAGLLGEALPHAADAGDWQLAADRLVEDLAIGRLLTGLDADRLVALFARMTPDASGPAVDLVRAARELAGGAVERGIAHLTRAETELRKDGAGTSEARRFSCALLRVLAARMTGSADLAETAALEAEAARLALPADRLAQHPELPALMLTDLGSAQLWAGRFDAARTALTAAMQSDPGSATAFPRHECLSRLALLDLLLGWPGRAEQHARNAVAEAERSGLPPAARTGMARLVLAAVDLDRGDPGTARDHLDQAADSSAAPHDPLYTAALALIRARLRLAQGDPEGALHTLVDLEKPSTVVEPSPWVRERGAVAAASAHLAAGRPRAAARVFEEHPADGTSSVVAAACVQLACGAPEAAATLLDGLPAGPHDGPAITVRALLARARAAELLGDDGTAQRLVARALHQARPERLLLPFLEAGPWLRPLLRQRPQLTRGHTWLPVSLAGRPREAGPSPAEAAQNRAPVVVEDLSEREHEVLERLAQMMSTEEIAADLYLSVNTVKTHLKSIYRKLAVTRRGEAVRRARELKLLP
ncbi:LuxR C-terminal-related transcriptional regulator [Streptomyces mangrovisoli]|uniref:Helix-turn-helix transcriptional regulator n=1 Tax=Streptomyces mangrovisoli TaxID=1428628 RepID=A0A1J4NVP6_9ACTN|nr:LuxR C-terminal-related transcriptional regulator [Streptomyces mangrovisoli]OIJ66577.1 helix-turn-helix transcriptional regulator [Streptomyces mangrovisoli]